MASASLALFAYHNASAAMDSLDVLAKCEKFANGMATRDSMRPTGSPTDEQRKSVELSRSAQASALRGEYASAADLYKEAYALWGMNEACTNTDAQFALGISELRAGRDLDAIRDLWEYAEEPDAPPEKVKMAQETIQAIGSRTAHVNVGDRLGISFIVDGELSWHSRVMVRTPTQVAAGAEHFYSIYDVTPGAHELFGWRDELREGKRVRTTWHASVVVKPGEEVTAVFEKATAPSPPDACVPAP